jgi:hypothetical protein
MDRINRISQDRQDCNRLSALFAELEQRRADSFAAYSG